MFRSFVIKRTCVGLARTIKSVKNKAPQKLTMNNCPSAYENLENVGYFSNRCKYICFYWFA